MFGCALPSTRREIRAASSRVDTASPRSSSVAPASYAATLTDLRRFEEAKSLLRKTIPVARRVFGESNDLTLKLRWSYGGALCEDAGATLDDLREAATTLEETERIARRVMGGLHPTTTGIENALQEARAALRARETPRPGNA